MISLSSEVETITSLKSKPRSVWMIISGVSVSFHLLYLPALETYKGGVNYPNEANSVSARSMRIDTGGLMITCVS